MAFTAGPRFNDGVVLTAFATGTGAINETLTLSHKYAIYSIALHLSAAGGEEDFVARVDHGQGSMFDFNLVKEGMSGFTDYVYQSSTTGALYFTQDDSIVLTYANSAGRTWGIMVTYGYAGYAE